MVGLVVLVLSALCSADDTKKFDGITCELREWRWDLMLLVPVVVKGVVVVMVSAVILLHPLRPCCLHHEAQRRLFWREGGRADVESSRSDKKTGSWVAAGWGEFDYLFILSGSFLSYRMFRLVLSF